jgi:hypothetical protein
VSVLSSVVDDDESTGHDDAQAAVPDTAGAEELEFVTWSDTQHCPPAQSSGPSQLV